MPEEMNLINWCCAFRYLKRFTFLELELEMILQLEKTTKLMENKEYHQLRRVRDVQGSEMEKRKEGRIDTQQIVEEKATNFVGWAEHLPPYIIISA